MSLQFILGGSGRGKTYYIQHKAVSEAFGNPQKEYIINKNKRGEKNEKKFKTGLLLL